MTSAQRLERAKGTVKVAALPVSAVRNAARFLAAHGIGRSRGTTPISVFKYEFGQPGQVVTGTKNPIYSFLHESGHARHYAMSPQKALSVTGNVSTSLQRRPEWLEFARQLKGEHAANTLARRWLPRSQRADYSRTMTPGGINTYKTYGPVMTLRGSGSGEVGGTMQRVLNRAVTLSRWMPQHVFAQEGDVILGPGAVTGFKSIRRNMLKSNPVAAKRFRELQGNPDLRKLLSKRASAKGIPSRKDYGDLSQVHEGDLLDYVIQRHLAQRAGPHFDLRMGSPRMGLYSWASRKGVPHGPGEKTLAVQQPVHRFRYRNFEGEIPRGQYGSGTVSKVREGKLLITRTSPDSIHFTEATGQKLRRFALVKPRGQDKNWLLIRAADPERPDVEKESYDVLAPDEASQMMDYLSENGVFQPKVDGAMAFLRLAKGRMEVLSHRQSKRTGGAIAHTERMFGRAPSVDYPKEFENSVLRGEVFGERGGKAIPPQELGGILNAGIGRSLQKQKDQDVALKMMLFGVAQQRGKPAELTYDEQRGLLEQILSNLPEGKFTLPEEARTVEEASRMLEQIQSGQHPLTREGMVWHPLGGGTPSKIKFRPEQDVFVREVYPGKGKYKGVGAGGFRYSTTEEGPILGNVGGGLSDELRYDMLLNPEAYFGRRARVAAQGAFPSGALRAPSLIALHEG